MTQQRRTTSLNHHTLIITHLLLLSAACQLAASPVATVLTPTRAEMLLNGPWEFVPLSGQSSDTIQVPSSWTAHSQNVMHGGVTYGELERASYRRTVPIPAQWQGRRIVLDIRRVSTEADVSINGKQAGTLGWPGGELDVTEYVRPGTEARFEITVTARQPEGETWVLMGYATEERRRRQLASRGITGDVFLRAEPLGVRIADVFAKPSVRNKRLDLEVELADAQPGTWEFTAKLFNPKDNSLEREFTTSAQIDGQGRGELGFEWENPRLWDFGKPELYLLHLEARPAGAAQPADVYPLEFGFREIWIEGRDFYLNGTKIRFRPRGGGTAPAHPAEIRAFIEGLRGAGYNISQIWPVDSLEPGSWNFWELVCEEASRMGWPLMGVALSFKDLALNQTGGVPNWTANPKAREAWVAMMRREMKRFRNYPAILMWGTTGNINNHFADQDPRFLGQREKLLRHPQRPHIEKVAIEALDEIRRADPTRPVFVHAGSRLGDVFTINHYLNLLPLQEREEMPSEHARSGDVPMLSIEFGTPLNTTMNRGRAGFGPSHKSEPFATEYAAIYLGPQSYTLEPRAYRRNIRFGYNGKDWDGDWLQVQWLQSSGEPFQKLQALFIRNTWRSWRAWGVTGGMVPWNDTHQIFLLRDRSKREPAPEPAPGQRGPRPPTLAMADTHFLKPEGGWIEMDSARALREVNGPVLAYIGGPPPTDDDPGSFTAKDHNFAPGASVRKSAVLINDTGRPQNYTLTWRATLGGRPIADGQNSGTIAQAENLFLPIEFTLPQTAEPKTRGEISLAATIGEHTFEDTFAFTLFGPDTPRQLPAAQIFDPEGKTTEMLRGLGMSVTPWDGKPSKNLLIIGREVLSKLHKLPGSLPDHLRAGGRLLIFTQAPDFLRDAMGLRVSEHVARRLYPVDPAHPALGGLDAEDLRDWSATATLRDPFPVYPTDAIPPYGWRWGNRGAVSSAMIETPHLAGWRPLLQGDFDLAYSPLLELHHAGGAAILCTLDLEDAWRSDPAAARLARALLTHAGQLKPQPARKTVYLGSDADFAFLTNDLGLTAEKLSTLPLSGANTLAVIGADAAVTTPQLENFARSGGHVVALARKTPGQPGAAGGKIINAASFIGARETPALDGPAAAALAGLTVSEARFRSDHDWPVFEKSPDTFLDGLAHVRALGSGRIVQTQFEPRWFDTNKLPMFRLTRWRHTRALVQILANAGAQFRGDLRPLEPRLQRLSLAGPWKVRITKPLPVTPWDNPHTDPGLSDAARAAAQPDFDDSGWDTFTLPAWYPPLEQQSGEVVWRREISIPPEWEGQILQLGVGRVKSFDTTFLNGREVGSTGPAVKDAWNLPRRYRIPAAQVKGGRAVIVVRQFAPDFQGGIHGRPEELFLRPVAAQGGQSAALYHPDYREEFDFGDNPFRYYRW